jgi:hypothetical protein
MQRGPWAPFFVPIVVIVVIKASVTHEYLANLSLPYFHHPCQSYFFSILPPDSGFPLSCLCNNHTSSPLWQGRIRGLTELNQRGIIDNESQ